MRDGRQASRKRWYRWLVLGMVSAVYGVSVMDRSLLAVLQAPIKVELHLTDTELGLLMGAAFAFLFATLAVPLGRLADRTNRVIILSTSLVLWSAMTIGCGVAASFTSLLFFRIGLGVGEAGSYPASASLITDYFAKSERATAFAIFGLAVPLGSALGFFLGGWVNAAHGWRGAFIAAGGLGMVIAPAMLIMVRETERGSSDAREERVQDAKSASFFQILGIIWRLRALRYLILANVLCSFVYCAYQAWQPTFYIRYFHISTALTARTLGLLALLSMIGTLVAGVLADRLGRRDSRWYLWILALIAGIQVPAVAAQLFAQNLTQSWVAAAVPATLMLAFAGPTNALCQTLVLPHMRATTASVSLLLTNLVGLGLGPLFVGVMSDWFSAMSPTNGGALRYALLAAFVFQPVAIWSYLKAGNALPKDLERYRVPELRKA